MGQIFTALLVLVLVVVVPYGNIKRYLLADPPDLDDIPKKKLIITTCVSLAILGALGIFSTTLVGVRLFKPWHPTFAEISTGFGMLAAFLAGRFALLGWIRSDPRRSRISLAPKKWSEFGPWVLISLCAGVFEETAYRGALFIILSWFTGSQAVAFGVATVSFALAHFRQGWRSVLFIAGIAAALQLLVMVTGSLYMAIIVHTLYDSLIGVMTIAENARPRLLDTVGTTEVESAIFSV